MYAIKIVIIILKICEFRWRGMMDYGCVFIVYYVKLSEIRIVRKHDI